jgi:hypothetical protein
MTTETIPITENLYSLAMALMGGEGLEVKEIRERLHREVDSICDAIKYGDN